MFHVETLSLDIRVGEQVKSGLFCLQSKHPACECFWTVFLQGGFVSTSPKPQSGGAPLVDFPRLFFQFIRSYPPYRRPFLYPQPGEAPFRGDRNTPHGLKHSKCDIYNEWFLCWKLKWSLKLCYTSQLSKVRCLLNQILFANSMPQ